VSGFTAFLAELRPQVDAELDRLLPREEESPARLHAAMRYSVFAGGKRVRPALAVLAGETFGAPRAALLPGAAALELIHTYSLVHDDLPALDDDDLRRGRPTVHRRFDEATAILAGDALLTRGLWVLASEPPSMEEARRSRAASLVGEAISTHGMIGGQMDDLEAEHEWPQDAAAALERIHRRKTGALLRAAVRLGGLYAGVDTAADRRLSELGAALGLLFQIADDILDVTGDVVTLGKTAGKDAEARKLTYPGLYGLEESRRRLEAVTGDALRLASELPREGGLFPSLIKYLASRTS
jgi:geranylgeranyl diphosphate synthase, type II